MATTDSIRETTTISAPDQQLATAWILYNHITLIVDQLDDDIRTLSHNALDAYNAENMRQGQLIYYLRVWCDEIVEVRAARKMVARHRREEAISIVHWAAHMTTGRFLPREVEKMIGDYCEE